MSPVAGFFAGGLPATVNLWTIEGKSLRPPVPSVSTPPTAELLQRLAVNPWFAALPAGERRALATQGDVQKLAAGEMLFRQGDEVLPGSGAFYGVLAGNIKASSLREDGKEAILMVLEPGDWFGEISLVDEQPRTHDATAQGPVEVLAVPRAAFDALMRRPDFALAIGRMLAGRVRSLMALVEDATLRSTQARLARRLIVMSQGIASQTREPRPVVPVSQEALAMMLGVSRQTLSKELQQMVQAGAIALGYGRITIASREKLESFGRDL